MLHHQNGNALFLILIAVALFAALSYSVTQSSRGGGNIDNEKAMIAEALTEQCLAAVQYGADSLKMLNNCAEEDLDYTVNDTAASDRSCHIFAPEGGNVSPCGIYRCEINLDSLALGEKCRDGDIVYAGDSGGNRMYTTISNIGDHNWGGRGFNVGTTSETNGIANTNTLVDHETTFPAAEACRALGPEWYLPARNELYTLYTNRNTGDLNGTFPNDAYWSSTEVYSEGSRVLHFGSGNYGYHVKNSAYPVRCVRQ